MKNTITCSIVTYYSDHIIFKTLNQLKKLKVIIIENSLDKTLKKKIKKKYKNVKVIIPKKNLGYGAGNNLAISKIKTKYCLILNPDAYISKKNIKKLNQYIKTIPSFGILLGRESRFDQTTKFFKNKKKNYTEVRYDNFYHYASGCCMLINLNLLKKNKINFFDENFFLNEEESDLIKRCEEKNIKTYLLKNCIVNHIPTFSSNPKLKKETEVLRHFHYNWSRFYFLKKHFGFRVAFRKMLIELFKSFIMTIWNLILFKRFKFKKYKNRFLGLASSMLGIKSYKRI